MSPRLTFTLTLLGVLLAGGPLLVLTDRHAAAQADAPAAGQESAGAVMAEVRFDGAPESLRLLFRGAEVAALPAGTSSPWMVEIPLPADATELELEAAWPNAGQHAVTITLMRGSNAATDTQWSDPAATTLHTLFSFPW